MRTPLLLLLFIAAFGQTPKTAYVLIIGLEFPQTASNSPLADHREFPASITGSQTDKYGTRRVFTPALRDRVFGYYPSLNDYFGKNSKHNVVLVNAGVYGPYAADEPADHYWAPRSGKCQHGWNDGHRERRTLAIERFIEQEINLRKTFSLAAFDRDNNGLVGRDELIVVVICPWRYPDGFVRGAQRQEGSNSPWNVGNLEWDLWGNDDGVIEVFSPDMLQTADLGVLAHETAHVLINAGDEYENANTLPNANPPGWDPTAPGPYSLMDQQAGHPYLDPLHRIKATWLTPKAVPKDGYYLIDAIENGGPVYRLADPNSHQGEYFLIKNRRRAGYDSSLPDDGLAIWHIDENRLPNYRTAVEIEPASGPMHPIDYSQYLWEGATRDFWQDSPGLNSRWHDNGESGIGVWAISRSSSTMRAYLDVPGPGLLVQAFPIRPAVPRGSRADFFIRLVNTGPERDTFDLSIHPSRVRIQAGSR